MPWEKTKNPWSIDAADPLAEESILQTGMVGGVWGTVPASSKELDISEVLQMMLVRENARAQGPSGWYRAGAMNFSGAYPANTFRMDSSKALLSGLPIHVVGANLDSDTENVITLNSPPGAGTHDDLVFLEAWLAEVPGSTPTIPVSTAKPSTTTVYKYGNVQYGGTHVADDINEVDFEIRRRIQLQYRIRVISDVDFTGFPQGMNDPTVLAQGGAANPTAIQFAADPDDGGLFIAGNGSETHQASLVTLNGLVWAVPIARVARTTGVTVITSGNVIDLRTNSGALNSVARTGDTMSGTLFIDPPDSGAILALEGAGGSGIEIGRIDGVASSPLIDFHSGATAINYDSRLVASGGTGTVGQGTLDIQCTNLLKNNATIRHDANSPRYNSTQQTVVAGTTLTVAHGFSVEPSAAWAVGVCITTEFGFAVDDEMRLDRNATTIANDGVSVSWDDTNVYCTIGTDGLGAFRRSATIGANVTLTPANWKIEIRADP